VTSPAAAGQPTISDETICDGNGVSWGDGGCVRPFLIMLIKEWKNSLYDHLKLPYFYLLL